MSRALGVSAAALLLAAAVVACTTPAAPPRPAAVAIAPTPEGREAPDASPPRPTLTRAQQAHARQLVEALRRADRDERTALLRAMRDEVGGAGLVMALDVEGPPDETQRWFRIAQVTGMIRRLADPDAADALAAWAAEPERHGHWRGVAGAALAEIGDLRAARLLAERLRLDPQDLYDPEKFWQADEGGHLSRSDRPRIEAARLLADLARMHPGDRERIRAQAEESVRGWLQGRPQPHANGLRFLAAAACTKELPQLRSWAFPSEPLPDPGAMPPFPVAYEIAQVGLRYLGWMRDRESLAGLIAQLGRKDPQLDISQQALMTAPIAMRGMALRAIAYGAAQGLAHWGPEAGEAARDALVTLIEDPTWHEEARLAACQALPWVAEPRWLATLPDRIARASGPAGAGAFVAGCYAEALAHGHLPDTAPPLVALLDQPLAMELRLALAQAVGRSGLADDETTSRLERLAEQETPKGPATLALVLGASPDVATRALAGLPNDASDPAVAELADAYYRSFGYLSDRDWTEGALARWVGNARAAAEAGHPWLIERLQAQLDNLLFDNGPHSLTRPVLRHAVLAAARSNDAATRHSAITVLAAMREQGALMALARDRGEQAALASRALRELGSTD